MKTKNPAGNANRALVKIAAIAKPLDNQNPTENTLKTQSEMLAARAVMRRCRVSFWHALVICRASGLGGINA